MERDFRNRLSREWSLEGPPSLAYRLRLDLALMSMLLLLCMAGLLVLYSASSKNMDIVTRQVLSISAGFAAMLLIARVPVRYLQWLSPLIYTGGLALLLAVLVTGHGAKGAQRWIALPGFRFQPSEIMKLVMPLMVAAWLCPKTLPLKWSDIIVSLGIIVLPTVLIARQPDLGTALLVAVSGFFVLLLAGLGWRLILGALLMALPSAWAMWNFFMRDYQKQRVLTFLSPETDPWGAGWNIIQSRIAIGSGGIDGKGWLMGTQSHLDFLPESHTDFIIAVLAEEFGLIGILVLLVIYGMIIGRGIYIALSAQNRFSGLIAGSIILTFFVYIFVNIGMVAGLLPVVGVPLPLISRGGTSVVTLLLGFGILMSVHNARDSRIRLE
ncbi:MAG: rod shape-determining protein RodA [Kistimonas sp.]|nr:rod shape-determining protein RodA [Kistimonas sp.]